MRKNGLPDKLMAFLNTTSDASIEKALKNKLDVITTIKQEAMSDEENESYNLLMYYYNADEEERSIMDCVLCSICGWSMNNIIDKSYPIEWAEDEEDWLPEADNY